MIGAPKIIDRKQYFSVFALGFLGNIEDLEVQFSRSEYSFVEVRTRSLIDNCLLLNALRNNMP